MSQSDSNMHMSSHWESDNFCQIIGAGATEPRKGWHHSGLLLVVEGRPYLFDATPQNWLDFGDWLFHKQATFLVTHGHMDHFDPEHPWVGIFDPSYANFGLSKHDDYSVHLYGPQGVVDLLLRINGFDPELSAVAGDQIEHKRARASYHQLRRVPDGRTLHLHGVRMNAQVKVGEVTCTPIDSLHDWSYPPEPPYHVKGCVCAGYMIEGGNKRYLYLPDFRIDSEGKLEASIVQAVKSAGTLDYFIVGCSNPDERYSKTHHSGPADIYQLYVNLRNRKVITHRTIMVFTHLNPNWEREDFSNPGFPEEKLILAENGKVVYAG